MRLVTYERDSHAPLAGVALDGVVVDLHSCAQRAALDSAVDWTSLKTVLAAADEDVLKALAVAAASLRDQDQALPRAAVRLLPPVPDPEKIVCIGLNYRDHVEEAQREVATLGTQKDPVVFSKFTSALIADGEPIMLPSVAPDMIDWEGELAVVMGRTCSHVSFDEALAYVAGYTVFNDGSGCSIIPAPLCCQPVVTGSLDWGSSGQADAVVASVSRVREVADPKCRCAGAGRPRWIHESPRSALPGPCQRSRLRYPRPARQPRGDVEPTVARRRWLPRPPKAGPASSSRTCASRCSRPDPF